MFRILFRNGRVQGKLVVTPFPKHYVRLPNDWLGMLRAALQRIGRDYLYGALRQPSLGEHGIVILIEHYEHGDITNVSAAIQENTSSQGDPL